ncbi:MAG TPA: PHP domain-containing protein [Methanocella sp.]|nr:PHP domain-containing protein [Methanocella sp.]
MLRFDLHVHSDHSPDGHSTVEEILRAAQRKGLDGVAITDHDTTSGAVRALEVRDRVAPGLLVIPGQEISTKAGHLIVLGLTQELPPGQPVRDTIAAAHRLGGTVVVPHPDQRTRHGMRIPPGADAVEVYNSRYILGVHNRMTTRKAGKRKLSAVAGSDAHVASMVGQAITEVDAPKDVAAVLRAIREGRTRIVVKKTPLHVYMSQLTSGWARRAKSIISKL